jgi:hypothetical protein
MQITAILARYLGYLLIKTFYDENNNKKMDIGEGLPDMSFRIGANTDDLQEFENATNESGMLFIPIGVGQHSIEMIPKKIPKKNGEIQTGIIKMVDIERGKTAKIDFLVNIPANTTDWEKHKWKFLLVLYFIILLICMFFKERITPNKKPPFILKSLVMIFISTVFILLVKQANLESYQNYIIIPFGILFLSFLLDKIVEILIAHTAGSVVAGFFQYLSITNIFGIQTGSITPLGEMTNGLRLLFLIISLALMIISGYFAEGIYNYLKGFFHFSDKLGIPILIIILLITNFYFEEDDNSIKISGLVSNEAHNRSNSFMLWTAKINNPNNKEVLFKFYLDGMNVTDWQSQNKWNWTINEANSGTYGVSFKIKYEGDNNREIVCESEPVWCTI